MPAFLEPDHDRLRLPRTHYDRHLVMIQSQFETRKQTLCCNPDAGHDAAHKTKFTFTYLAWSRGSEDGADRNRAATISAMQGKMMEVMSTVDVYLTKEDMEGVNGTIDTAVIDTRFQTAYN